MLAAITLMGISSYAQSDSLGMPGDNLDLRAVLNIFKESKNPEDFEKKLNAADTKVNNLDLNNDDQVDYLRVVDSEKDGVHTIVIQAPISKSESQDVAVIEVEKKDDQTAHIQIVGDETLYGKDYIIEPDEAKKQKTSDNKSTSYNDDVYNTATKDDNSSSSSSSSSGSSNSNVVVNVWAWPAVSYMYAPGYTFWVSPWYWGYYPGWYSPWRPYGWWTYRGYMHPYHYGFYTRRVYVYRAPAAHQYYYGRRVSSGYVVKTAPGYHPHGGTYMHGRNVAHRTNPGGMNKPRNTGKVYNNNGMNKPGGNPGSKPQRMQPQQNNPGKVQGPPPGGGGVKNNPGGGKVIPGGGGRSNSGMRPAGGGGGVNPGGGGRSHGGGGGMRPGGGGGGGHRR